MKAETSLGRAWRVGCAGFPMKLSRYFETFGLVEVQQSFLDPPKERTLARWRRQAGEEFVFTIRAWQLITHPPTYPGYRRIRRPWEEADQGRFGSLQLTEQTRWAWEITRRAAEILDAKAILFHTPASFTPTQRNRENLVRFFHSIERGPCHLVWDPEGMWEDEEIEALCRECDLIPAIDPLLGRPCSGETFYFRMQEKTRGRGAHTEDDFFQIRGRALAGFDPGGEGFFIWQTPDAAGDARRFVKWCSNQC
jgi:uncharacterized protein YecE (DUF72 family)